MAAYLNPNFVLPNDLITGLSTMGYCVYNYKFKNSEYTIVSKGMYKFYFQLINYTIFNATPTRLSSTVFIITINSVQALAKGYDTLNQIITILNYPINMMMNIKQYPTVNTPLNYSNCCKYIPSFMGSPVINWPTKLFAPYVDATAWPPYVLTDSPSLFLTLGFIVSATNTDITPSWGGYYTYDKVPQINDIPKLRALGGDIAISFGGAANTPIHILAKTAEQLKGLYKEIVLFYNLTRIDFDIEGAWLEYYSQNVLNAQALKLLQTDLSTQGRNLDITFTLPILTTGLTNDGITILSQALTAGVTIKAVNAMTMDYGPPISNMGQAAIDAINSLFVQLKALYTQFNIPKTDAELWQMVGATPMIGPNDIQGETFTLANATQLVNFASMMSSKGLPVGELSMWSSNLDTTTYANSYGKIFNTY